MVRPPLVSRKVLWSGMGGDGFQTQKKKSWVSGQVRAARVLADAIIIDGKKEWTCKFCSETNVWTRWRCRCCGTTFLRVCKANISRHCVRRTESGTLAQRPRVGGEEWKSQEQEEITRFRAQVELLSKQQGTGKSPEEPGEPGGEEVAWKKDVRWNLKRRQTFRESWMSKRQACSGSCGD